MTLDGLAEDGSVSMKPFQTGRAMFTYANSLIARDLFDPAVVP